MSKKGISFADVVDFFGVYTEISRLPYQFWYFKSSSKFTFVQ